MSWLDKLKHLLGEEKPEVENVKPESVKIEQVNEKVNEKIKQNFLRKDELKNELTKRIDSFKREMNNSIEILEKVTLSERKEHEKIKLVVLENLSLYDAQLKRLISQLENLESLKIKEGLAKLKTILNDFDRASHLPFEKATILIGKELEGNRNILRAFIKDFSNIEKNNKSFFEQVELTDKLNALLGEMKQVSDFIEEVNKTVLAYESQAEKKREEHEKTKQKIDEIKKSDEFKKEIELKENHRQKLNDIETEIRITKQKIDFKALTKTYHLNEKANHLIKSYSGDFLSALKNDENLDILDLIGENEKLKKNELKDLREKVAELNRQFQTKTDAEILELENNLKNLDSHINQIKSHIETEKKKKDRSSQKLDKFIDEIKSLSEQVFSNLKIE
ncbi:MAG: hypothetical protein AABX85_04700 [Nanoarchaeota archaeon]